MTFPTISDGDAAIYERFEIPVQPALVVIDGSGAVETVNGSVNDALLDEVFRAAIDP